MTVDILTALADKTDTGTDRCVIGRWLDEFPPDTPGLAQLMAAFTERDRHSPDWRDLPTLARIARRLGKSTSAHSVGEHRRHVCVCGP